MKFYNATESALPACAPLPTARDTFHQQPPPEQSMEVDGLSTGSGLTQDISQLSFPAADLPLLPGTLFPDGLPAISGLPSPSQPATDPTVPGRWACPFGCPGKSWANSQPCLTHIERTHLAGGETLPPDSPWLLAANRQICRPCCLLVPRGAACRQCHRRIDLPSADPPPAAGPDLGQEVVTDTDWENVLLKGLPVIRFVPHGAQSAFFSQLALELERITPDSGAAAVWRLAAFCRIILQPVGRGGRRHCKQTVAIVAGRLARWAAGQQAALVKEYPSGQPPPAWQQPLHRALPGMPAGRHPPGCPPRSPGWSPQQSCPRSVTGTTSAAHQRPQCAGSAPPPFLGRHSRPRSTLCG